LILRQKKAEERQAKAPCGGSPSVGTSTESWEDAAKNVIEQAGKHLRELRVAEVVAKDMVLRDGKVELYRTKVKVSFKYEGHG
jgi:flavin-binding protein dodecin